MLEGQFKATFISHSPGSADFEEFGGYPREKSDSESDSEFFEIPFRALSATIIPNRFIDFSHKGGAALRKSRNMLDGLVVATDHYPVVENILGRVTKVKWDKGSEDTPPGINVLLSIDKSLNFVRENDIIRKLETGLIDSVSVSVLFDWKASHPDLEEEKFWSNIGKKVKGGLEDNDMVRFLVTEIKDYFEISFVFAGADPYARRQEKLEVSGLEGMPFEGEETSSVQEEKEDDSLGGQFMYEKLAKALGIKNYTEEELEQMVIERISELVTLEKEVESVNKEVTSLKEKNDELETQVAENSVLAMAGKAYIESLKSEITRLSTLVDGEEFAPIMQNLVADAKVETMETVKANLEKRQDKMFPFVCKDCGSNAVSRQSSLSREISDANDSKSDKKDKKSKKTIHSD